MRAVEGSHQIGYKELFAAFDQPENYTLIQEMLLARPWIKDKTNPVGVLALKHTALLAEIRDHQRFKQDDEGLWKGSGYFTREWNVDGLSPTAQPRYWEVDIATQRVLAGQLLAMHSDFTGYQIVHRFQVEQALEGMLKAQGQSQLSLSEAGLQIKNDTNESDFVPLADIYALSANEQNMVLIDVGKNVQYLRKETHGSHVRNLRKAVTEPPSAPLIKEALGLPRFNEGKDPHTGVETAYVAVSIHGTIEGALRTSQYGRIYTGEMHPLQKISTKVVHELANRL